ncbi:MAG: GspH/FimT family pseudopilin [Gammaproteobacteria bacterium]|nr:GspH/FimT family pseudopilin [Gammaproteobacteria bacterium]
MDTYRGFTIIELMITILIVSILLAIGVPSMQTLIMNNRLTSSANNFLTELNLARSEAIKRGVQVVVCRTNAPNADPPVCGAGTANTWTDGWITFVNDNDVLAAAYDDGSETLLRVSSGLEGGLTLMADDNAEENLIFNADASLGNGAAATLALCDDRGGEFGRYIRISPTGRPNIVRIADVEDPPTDGHCTP